MQCAYHPQMVAAGTCGDCGKPLCADCSSAGGLCTLCVAQDAVQDLQQADQERTDGLARRDRRRKQLAGLRVVALWGLVGLCVVVAGWQLPTAVSSIQPDKPLRLGTYHTDAATDACIANLWTASRLLQEGKSPPATLVCPASGRAYAARQAAQGIVFHCPQPALHGLRALRVSRRSPVPEVVK